MLRSNLPNEILLPTGERLVPYIGGMKHSQVIEFCKKNKMKFRKVEVLHRNLRHRTNFHGRPYEPTEWIFIEVGNLLDTHISNIALADAQG